MASAPVDLGRVFDNFQGHHDSLIGMVVNVMLPPKQSRTGEFMVTFTITDAVLAKRNIAFGGLKVRVFCRQEYQLPQVRRVGDVVLLRNVYGKYVGGELVIVNDKQKSSYAVFYTYDIPAVVPRLAAHNQSDSLPDICLSTSYSFVDKNWTPSRDEQIRAIVTKRDTELVLAPEPTTVVPNANVAVQNPTNQAYTPNKQAYTPIKQAYTPNKQSYSPDKKDVLIKDAQVNGFCNLVVEVVKIFHLNQDYGDCEIYVTDYTGNDLLFSWPAPEEKDDGLYGRDGDDFGYVRVTKREWPGPYGSLTLKVEVQEPHASAIRKSIKEGDVIFMQNVRAKMSRMNNMEGNLWRDNRFPDKVLVHLHPYETDERYKSLMKRKEKYWAGRKHIKGADEEPEKPLSKAQKKKLKQKEKKKAAAAADGQPPNKKPKVDHDASDTSIINKHVRSYTLNDAMSTPLFDILMSEGTNTKTHAQLVSEDGRNEKTWKATVRVVDFSPSKIEDFTSPKEAIGEDPIDEAYPSQIWQWDFWLLVEDGTPSKSATSEPKTQLWVQVEHADAEHLLDQEATDLNSRQQDVWKLREKLAVLWGNLEERKIEAQENNSPYTPSDSTSSAIKSAKRADPGLSNLPFACCIRQFEKTLDQVDSEELDVICYGLFGTSIKS